MHERTMLRGLGVAALGLSLVVFATRAYPSYESISSVASHYDSNGSLVGVEAFGPCGLSLYGTTGAYTDNEVISCEHLDEVELPY